MNDIDIYIQQMYNFSNNDNSEIKVQEFGVGYSEWVDKNVKKAFEICKNLEKNK